MNRLMIVDDEPHVVHALMRVMRHGLKGVKAEGFDNPLQALKRATETSFQVIVSDFRMPQMDGISFLRQVRATQPHAVRLILSASTEVHTITSAINEVEVFRYLVKPWHDDELLDHIRAAFAQAASAMQERSLADEMRLMRGQLSPQEVERQRLEALEPGITNVEWGPHGEVLMPDLGSLDEQAASPPEHKRR